MMMMMMMTTMILIMVMMVMNFGDLKWPGCLQLCWFHCHRVQLALKYDCCNNNYSGP